MSYTYIYVYVCIYINSKQQTQLEDLIVPAKASVALYFTGAVTCVSVFPVNPYIKCFQRCLQEWGTGMKKKPEVSLFM